MKNQHRISTVPRVACRKTWLDITDIGFAVAFRFVEARKIETSVTP